MKELIDLLDPPILYSDHHEGDGQQLFVAASRLKYEESSQSASMRRIGQSELKLGSR